MNDCKVCERCGGVVDVSITQEQQTDGTIVSYAEGVCRSCGHRYGEAELLKLDGPGPVGG